MATPPLRMGGAGVGNDSSHRRVLQLDNQTDAYTNKPSVSSGHSYTPMRSLRANPKRAKFLCARPQAPRTRSQRCTHASVAFCACSMSKRLPRWIALEHRNAVAHDAAMDRYVLMTTRA